MTLEELLPPGVYYIWSPFDSYEAKKDPALEVPV